MVQSYDKHTAGMGRDFSAYLIDLGFPENDVFAGTDLSTASFDTGEEMVSIKDLARVVENGIRLTGDDMLVVKWGQKRRFARLGLIGYLGRTSSDVRAVILNLARYHQIFSESMVVDISDLDTNGSLAWRFDLPADVDIGRFVEGQVSQFLGGLSALLPRTLVPKEVHFTFRRKNNIADLQKLIGCPLQFGQPWNRIVFRQADLDLPLSTSDEGLNRILQKHADMVLEQRPNNRPDIQIAVERAIADRMATGQTSVNYVAGDLGMSPRTLARRLGDVNTTYQNVLSNFRRAMADRYLKNSDMSQSEIAYLLGYSDVSSFASAFKRWTGQSPGERRQSLV